MILQGLGPCLIARLLRAEREREAVSDWLLFGPTNPEVVEAAQPEAEQPEAEQPEAPWLLAAE